MWFETNKNAWLRILLRYLILCYQKQYEHILPIVQKRNEHPFPVVRPYSAQNPLLEFMISGGVGKVKGKIG